ncbi:hypothetical protein ACFQHO_47850 [Actinomadura yumaensis]|uniref:hypothetical protein n=1 Tax=Actinomadura yumaensis TaxID=111807 RepID=UPI003607A3A0
MLGEHARVGDQLLGGRVAARRVDQRGAHAERAVRELLVEQPAGGGQLPAGERAVVGARVRHPQVVRADEAPDVGPDARLHQVVEEVAEPRPANPHAVVPLLGGDGVDHPPGDRSEREPLAEDLGGHPLVQVGQAARV